MTTYCNGSFVKWLTFALLVCQVFSAPKSSKNEDSVNEIFSESKRDISSAGVAAVPLLKSPLFNPYMMYPPFVPGKPFMYPITPSDIILSKFTKSIASGSSATKPPPPTFDASDPSLMSAYFKAKKDEFLNKLFEKITNSTATSDISARSLVPTDVPPTTESSKIDSAFFLKKKYEFLDTLFKTLNVTSPPPTVNTTEDATTNATATTTPKPTIVPPDFWFPFAKLPKPTKAPKPTKPPKAKKILKDALDTILLQSLLIDMGVDPKDASLSKRAATVAALSKKAKSKKLKPEEDFSEFFIPPKVDPAVYSAKASDCLNKLFKILNKTVDDDVENFVEPKATVVPANLWTQPSETEYTSKLDAFLDLLIKSLNATDYPTEKPEKAGKPEKFGKGFKGKPGKKVKRSTFLDELLHRATTAPPTTTTTTPEPTIPSEDITIPSDPECDFVEILKKCCCSKCLEGAFESSGKSARSLIFKPFGSGYWIPQYLYAAKMGMYLDKLMDTINTAAATEVESESSDVLKRSVDPSDADDVSGLPSKEAAINLIIAELTELKNDIVDAFAEGIKAQKDSTPTPKPFGPGGKSFKKPFWGPKAATPTTDPVAPIQKRIDILTDVFDKLTKVEKTLIFAAEPEYDPKLLANLTEILEMSTAKPKVNKIKLSKSKPTPASMNPESPEYFLSKTKEYLKTLYGTKVEESEDK